MGLSFFLRPHPAMEHASAGHLRVIPSGSGLMRRALGPVLLAVCGLLLSHTLVWGASQQDYTIRYEYREPNQKDPAMMTKYHLRDGSKLRVEQFSADGELGMITIFRKDKGVAWMAYPNSMQFVERPLDQRGWEAAVSGGFSKDAEKYRKTGEGTVLQQPCDIYEMERNGKTTIGFISRSLKTVLRSESRENGEPGLALEATEILLEKPDESLFEVPAGYKPM